MIPTDEAAALDVIKAILEDYLEGDPKHLHRTFDYLGIDPDDWDAVEGLLRSDRLTFTEETR